jgi:iron-sulfur cluster repair protein YtfE (RIC family)
MTSNSKIETAAAGTPKVSVQDAITVMRAVHNTVNGLYSDFGSAPSMTRKKAVLAEMYTALSVHVQIEEEIFHPDVDTAMKDNLLVPEATEEHAGLIAQREGGGPDDETHDAKFKMLAEYVKHLVKEEQNEMFPKVKKRSLALDSPGSRLAVCTRELLAAKI